MSHEFVQGFAVREPAWHGLGVTLPDYPGRETAIKLAGHDFTVVERPVSIEVPVGDEGESIAIAAEGWKALLREDTNKVFNVVRDSYQIVQNEVLWDIVDAIVDQPNVKYETAGVLKGGALLWVLAWLDEPVTISGDNSPIYPFVLVSTTHDGSGAAKARTVSVRVVCWNTYSAADYQAKNSGLEFTFRHTKNVGDKIEDAKRALSGARVQHQEFVELAEELQAIKLNEKQVELFVTSFLPSPQDVGEIVSDRVVSNIEEARAAVRHILNGETISEGIRGTGYGAFQAGIEYLDHIRSYRSNETLFNRSLVRSEAAKGKLATLVREVALVA